MAARRIVVDLLRHGEPEGGAVLRGRIDPALTGTGRRQMRAAAALCGRDGPAGAAPWTRIVSSPLRRCREFAEEAAARARAPLTVDPRWQEIDYGEWDGMPLDRWRALLAERFGASRPDLSRFAPPGGEDFPAFSARVLAAWRDLESLPDGDRPLLVTHGGVFRVILPAVLGPPPHRPFRGPVPFACLSRVSIEASGRGARAELVFHDRAGGAAP